MSVDLLPIPHDAMLRLAENMRASIERMLPPDHDCPYPLQGGVNIPLPFEED
jgi:hypothetical protein